MGVGLLAKGVSPPRVSILAFGASQVAIDCEPLYHHFRHELPLHGPFHTVLIGGAVGVAVGALAWVLARRFTPTFPSLIARDLERGAALTGGLIGGVSHALLDGLVHSDVHALWPLAHTTWVLPPAGIDAVPVACVIAGVLGALLWVVRREQA
jgi:membrane-bound metal-dependent hydrolase YbcI (DUF457 family)